MEDSIVFCLATDLAGCFEYTKNELFFIINKRDMKRTVFFAMYGGEDRNDEKIEDKKTIETSKEAAGVDL